MGLERGALDQECVTRLQEGANAGPAIELANGRAWPSSGFVRRNGDDSRGGFDSREACERDCVGREA